MRITLSRSGGFAGLRLPPQVFDTTSVPVATADEIERLVAAADLPSAAKNARATSQPDRFSYTLTLARDGGPEEVYSFSETSVTPGIEALLRALKSASK